MTKKTPVYFLSHGGPSVMYDTAHPAYAKLAQIGKEITSRVKPSAVVVISAHWQAEKANTIEVNTAESTDLTYDFYGFPGHYYKETYPNEGSPAIAEKIISLVNNAGIKTKAVTRGLDHGVWAGFKVLFDPDSNPLSVPIIQVSLFSSESPSQHQALGRALAPLREEGVLIVASGMAVHNLRDMRMGRGIGEPLEYTRTFDEALKEAVESEVEEREGKMEGLLRRQDARLAHPTFEHLLPIYVAAGAAGEDVAKRLWTLHDGSMSWAQYRFGEAAEA